MPAQYAITVVAALMTGLIVGAIVMAVAARTRQLDEQVQASTAFRDLLTVAERYVSPEHRAALLRDAADLWDIFDPLARQVSAALGAPDRAPEYVRWLLHAYLTGAPLDFHGCWVPPDVQAQLRAAHRWAGASEAAAPAGRAAVRDLVTTVAPADLTERWPLRPRSSDG